MTKKIFSIIMIVCFLFSIFYANTGYAVSAGQESPITESKLKDVKKEAEKEKKKEVSYDPHIEKQGGVVLDSKKFPYEQYKPVAYIDGGWNPLSSENLMKSVNEASNVLFKFNLFISEQVDYFLSTWFDVQILNKILMPITQMTDSIFAPLTENLIPFLFSISLIFAVAYFIMGRVGQSMGVIFKGGMIFGLAIVWFALQVPLVNMANDISKDGQSVFMSANDTLANKHVEKGNEKDSTVANIRNYYFKTTVEKPYLLMNYGSVNHDEINSKKKNRIEELLTLKQNEEGNKQRESIAKKEVKDLKNSNMDSDSPSSKIVLSIVTIILNIAISVPLLFVAIIDMFLQILIPLTMLFLPISFAISMLPQFSLSVGKAFANLGMYFFIKMLVGLLITITLMVMSISELIIPITSVGSYVGNVFVSIAIYFVMWKKRHSLISFASGGSIRTRGKNKNNNPMKAPKPKDLMEKIRKEREMKSKRKQDEIGKINNELKTDKDGNFNVQEHNPQAYKEKRDKDKNTVPKMIKKLFGNNSEDSNNDLNSEFNSEFNSDFNTNRDLNKADNHINEGKDFSTPFIPLSKTGKEKEMNSNDLRKLQKNALKNDEQIKNNNKQYGNNPDFIRAMNDYSNYRKNHSKSESEKEFSNANKSPYYKKGIEQARMLEKQSNNLKTLHQYKDKILSEHKTFKSDNLKQKRIMRTHNYFDYLNRDETHG